MRVAVFSAMPFDREYLKEAARAEDDLELVFLEARLDHHTALLAEGCEAICAFVNDDLSGPVLDRLSRHGVKCVALRCAGFNNVDWGRARELGLPVGHVPRYSPYAVAEHAVALILALNRHVARAYVRVREGNLSLHGLLGFDLHGRVVGVVGTGLIGATFAKIMRGFGCHVIAFDRYPNDAVRDMGVRYVDLDELYAASDIISLHCPLTSDTFHLIDKDALAKMREGVMLINVSRGPLIDTVAVIKALKKGRVGYLGIDVYEEEAGLFFEDHSLEAVFDDVFARLLTFPNVMVTGHQAFFTADALKAISEVTVENLIAFAATGKPEHPIPVGA